MLAWFLLWPTAGHVWNEPALIGLLVGTLPWYMIIGFYVRRDIRLSLGHLVISLASVATFVVMEDFVAHMLVLFVICVPVASVVLLEVVKKPIEWGHARDITIIFTTLVWTSHLWDDFKVAAPYLHLLVFLRLLVWWTHRPYHQRWYLSVWDMPPPVLAVFLEEDDELSQLFENVSEWLSVKKKGGLKDVYDRLQKSCQVVEDQRWGPETTYLWLQTEAQARHGDLLRSPKFQLSLRNRLQGSKTAGSSVEKRGLLCETELPEISETSTDEEVVYADIGDVLDGSESEEVVYAELKDFGEQ